MSIKKIILPLLLPLVAISSLYAGDGTRDDVEVVNKYRFGTDFQIKLMKGLNLDIEPEFRFNGGFDDFILNGSLSYKTFGCIYWGATYRLICDREESDTASVATTSSLFWGDTQKAYEWECLGRYAFDVTYKDKFGRFTPAVRLRYNNFADDDGEDEYYSDSKFLRYKGKVEYDIRKCKLTPELAVEAFQELFGGPIGSYPVAL